jgi:hypothetical protein
LNATKLGLCLLASLTFSSVFPAHLKAQQLAASTVDASSLPDAPAPQGTATAVTETLTVDQSSSSQAAQTPAPSDPQASQTETPEQRKARAEAELKAEESQRMAGIVPNFMAVNNGKALPITPAQKFQLFFKGAFDSYQFVLAGIDAGIGQAEDSNRGYHQGLKGFARRYGANYGDNFDGNLWGNAILPSLLHQDPRYFRMGHGPILHRALYSISTTFRTRGDSGHWQPAYSNILGNLIGAEISNVYYPDYPDNERGLYPTLRRGLSVTYQGTIGGLLEEFYPDLSDLYKRHHARMEARKAAAAADGAARAQDPTPPATSDTPKE